MNKEYKIKLDLNKKIYNKKMAFNQFDENVNDFYIEVTKNNEVVKDLDKSIITLVAIKPNGEVDAQFIEAKEGRIYADLKPSMCDLVGNYQAKAMIVLEGEIVTTDTINYSVNEDKIISKLNDDIVSDERFTLFTDALARLSTVEISEDQRVINEAERILSEENRKIEEAKRVEAELIRQHEEADRTKYDATRESNENIRRQNESIRLANEANRIDEETKRVEEENKRKLAEEERKANYDFMTEDEERRRSEANAHKEAEILRVQAETNRVNEEAKRRTTEQGRISAENTRVNNENTRKANETTRQTNEAKRVEAETQRQNRYSSFIADAEANASNFENYTNSAKVKEEERKSNELDRKSQEAKRVSNEVERISNENTRKANEKAREKNETSRQYVFENKVDEVDKKIIEINATKDNFVSSINTKVDTKISELNTTKDNFVSSVDTKVDNKISELDNAKSDMTNTVSSKVNEVETRFNALTSKQQQDAEVIDARDGETSLKARLDRDIEKAKQVYVNVEGSSISTDSSVGYLKDVEILGNTIQDSENLADIRSVGDKVEGQELYEIPVLSRGKNLFIDAIYKKEDTNGWSPKIKIDKTKSYVCKYGSSVKTPYIRFFDENLKTIPLDETFSKSGRVIKNASYFSIQYVNSLTNIQLEEGTVATPYEPYVEDELTILSPVQLEKVGDVTDKIIEKDGVFGVEKWTTVKQIPNNLYWMADSYDSETTNSFWCNATGFGAIGRKRNEKSLYHKKLNSITRDEFEFSDTIGISTITNGEGFFIKTPKNVTVDTVNNYIAENGYEIICTNNTPQFIPLPHSQQIKLRTFANKTNISFGCEIEGTIKAQVPKSLGATVNTHTEQISNLNKELDRVKKLEESTVSTVTTESDFTTVEATSNGYFEDVKLEGKTLVNLGGNTNLWGVNSSGKSDVDYNIISANDRSICMNKLTDSVDYIYFGKKIDANLFKANTEYTIVCNVNNVNKFGVMSGNTREKIIDYVTVSNGYNCFKAISTDLSTVTGAQNILIYGQLNSPLIADNCSISDVIILEGDYTQNPPSYFEGLKSVGQSATTSEDGVDEIVVSSVGENLFDKNQTLINGYISMRDDYGFGVIIPSDECRTTDFIRVDSNITYTLNNDNAIDETCGFYDATKKCITVVKGNTVTSPSNAKYMRCTIKRSDFEQGFQIVRGTQTTEYAPHQSDKKRLLYYNEETQTWEKPVLREWDSIEKHANGKYYYHQRSGEVVLNGSENWNNDKNSSTMSPETYRQSIQFNAIDIPSASFDTKTSPNIISDLLPTVVFGDVYSYNRIGISISGTDSIATHIIINNNFTDVTELKQWLQANNLTVVYQLAQEKVYECTNIDLITYANETNFIVESGVLSPKTTLKVHNNISNVVSLLQKKVSLLESNVKASQEVQDMMILETDMRMLDIELALMEFVPITLNLGGSDMLRSATYFNFLKNHIINETYEKEYLENVMNKYLATGRINQDEYDELYKMLYPPVYDIELPIEY